MIGDANIASFDLELARDYEARRGGIQNENNSNGEKLVQDLSSEIAAVSDSFRNRLGMLQKQVVAIFRHGVLQNKWLYGSNHTSSLWLCGFPFLEWASVLLQSPMARF